MAAQHPSLRQLRTAELVLASFVNGKAPACCAPGPEGSSAVGALLQRSFAKCPLKLIGSDVKTSAR